jgi:TRAP-type C4-dicarboxylate transport system permease small subunit
MTTESNPPGNLLDRVAAGVNAIGALALVGVVVVQFWQVVARYVLNDSPSWSEPVSTLLLCTAMSAGAAVMVHRRAHFGFVLLRDAAPAALRRVLGLAGDLLVAAMGLAIAAWGARLAADGWAVDVAGAALPQGSFFVPLACGGVLIALFALAGMRTATAEGAP